MLELRLSRETIAGQAERLGYVTAERDAARAENDALRASQQPQAGSTSPEPTEPSRALPWPLSPSPNVVPAWGRWWPGLVALLVLLAIWAVVLVPR